MGEAGIHAAIEPLDGRVVHLRPVEPRDKAAVLAILTDPTVDQWWQSADAAADAEEKVRDQELAVWAIESDGEVVGFIQADEETEPMYRHASIDIVLAGAGQDRGLGSDALRAVCRWLFETRGHHRITIDPAAHNARAIRAYERVGFKRVGILRQYEGSRDGSWHDGLLMDMLAGELRD
ncbi:MAG TPA: GNAT family protein [Candidatus Limnocylindrales bacterium]|nr:GNAT family protein [Candidatus Limnocylindrales bacterium]